MTIFFLTAAPLLLAALLAFEKKGSSAGVLAVKPILSLLFVAVAWLRPWPSAVYAHWMLAGFLACVAGDVFLALRSPKAFRIGLGTFLIGHVCYTLAFWVQTGASWWTWGSLLGVAGTGLAVYRWLQPHLGSMRYAVATYIAVISLMVCGAFSVMGDSRFYAGARWLILVGAVCFYLSDLFVARQRFIRADFSNRLWGLPLYYFGQFLLALSVGCFRLI